MDKKNIKRLGIDLPINLAIEIKLLSARRNITIRKWVLRAIVEYINKERKFDSKD